MADRRERAGVITSKRRELTRLGLSAKRRGGLRLEPFCCFHGTETGESQRKSRLSPAGRPPNLHTLHIGRNQTANERGRERWEKFWLAHSILHASLEGLRNILRCLCFLSPLPPLTSGRSGREISGSLRGKLMGVRRR